MPTDFQDEAYFKAGVEELETYLLSEELFWKLSAKTDLPRLTVGGLLFARRRLEGGQRISGDREALDRELASVRAKWKVAWERKAAHEFRSRLNLWNNYLKDYRDSPAVHADEYPHRVRERVVLHLLGNQVPISKEEAGTAANLDRLLRQALAPGRFVWESRFSSVFPANEYWYLYGKLKSS